MVATEADQQEDYLKGIISFDPGYATGVAVGKFSHDTPLELSGATVVTYESWPSAVQIMREYHFDHVVSEGFTLNSGNKFTADLTGVEVEGVLDLAFGSKIVYRPRSLKKQVPDDLLREIGWWKTGKDVGWEDGRDANDAIIHMLGYVAFDLKHKPTLSAYFRANHND